MKHQPSLLRAVPARAALKTELILPYDDIRPMVAAGVSFELRDCICRKNKDLTGKRSCDFPLATCLTFSPVPREATEHTISKEKALEVLDQAEAIGLVHSVNNVSRGLFFVCNCCGCCCDVLRGITHLGIEGSIAKANYLAEVDEHACTGCGLCVKRCQVHACSINGTARVRADRCIGCGLCVTGCPEKAIHLKPKLGSQAVHPPDDYEAWEGLRLRNRGLL